MIRSMARSTGSRLPSPLSLSLSLLLVVAGACGEKSGGPAEGPSPPRPAPASPGAPRTGLTLTATGIAQLSGGTPMTQEGLSAALPGHTVELIPEDDYDEARFAVKAGSELLLEVRWSGGEADRKLRSVWVTSRQVATDLGVAIGDTHAAATRALGALRCHGGGEESDSREGLVICSAPNYRSLSFEFMGGDADQGQRMASELLDDPALLAASKLVTIVWSRDP
jgi:Protein of unknown function (DUF1131)